MSFLLISNLLVVNITNMDLTNIRFQYGLKNSWPIRGAMELMT